MTLDVELLHPSTLSFGSHKTQGNVLMGCILYMSQFSLQATKIEQAKVHILTTYECMFGAGGCYGLLS